MRELTTDEVITLGRAQRAHDRWQAARECILALYGPAACKLTLTHMSRRGDTGSEPVAARMARTTQMFEEGAQVIVTDASGHAIPFDLTTSWWRDQTLTEDDQRRANNAIAEELLGESLSEPLRTAVRDYAEGAIGIEFRQAWALTSPRVSLFDLATEPTLPFTNAISITPVASQEAVGAMVALRLAGQRLGAEEITQALDDALEYRRWERVYRYTSLLYGPAAEQIEITTTSIYNDSTYDQRPLFIARDGNDQRLYYDLTQPWWSRFAFTPANLAVYAETHPSGVELTNDSEGFSAEDFCFDANGHPREDDPLGAEVQNALNLLRRDLLDFEFAEVRDWETAVAAYDFRKPPILRFPHIYAEEAPLTLP